MELLWILENKTYSIIIADEELLQIAFGYSLK